MRQDRGKGCSCPEMHTNEGEKTGPICLPFSEASVGYLYDPSLQQYNVQYAT